MPSTSKSPVLATVALLRAGLRDEAARSLAAPPRTAEDWRASAMLHSWNHDWDATQLAFERAAALELPGAEWWCDLGLALLGSGSAEPALAVFENSLALSETPRAHIHLGEALELLSRNQESYAHFTQAAQLDPDSPDAIDGLARLACKLGCDEEALNHAKRAARLHRFDARSLQIVADMQFYSAQLETCLRTYRRALRLDPASSAIHSAYLFAALHDPKQTPASLRALHEDWFHRHAPAPGPRNFTHATHARPRIGYISVEFRGSPAEYFLLPLLQAHNRDRFDIYCYHHSLRDDATTAKYQQTASYWRNIATLPEDKALALIRADELDILVDTSGHLAPRIQPLLARRAAPVQVSLPIYPASTGCPAIDYIVTDRWTTPDSSYETQYLEKPHRLPTGYIVYAPPASAPLVDALPSLENQRVTFGLFQRPAKFNSALWRAIAEILQRTPDSRLLVHHGTRDLDDPSKFMPRFIARTLAAYHIAPDRLEFVGRRDLPEHLQTVARCDIALDTFPYSGHTTTGDALWMGVPVVTFAGLTHASRVSAGFLSRLDLADWIAPSLASYIDIASAKARDRAALSSLRAQLRPRMAASSICNARQVAGELESFYRSLCPPLSSHLE